MLAHIDEIYRIVNAATLIPWMLMILAPHWKWTKKIVLGFFFPVLFAVAYLLLFTIFFKADAFSEFSTLDGLLGLFSQKEAVLIGWLHYLAFDLLVGTWEYHDSQKKKVPHALLVPCLFFTLMMGPVGFLLYLLIRKFFAKN